MRILHLSSCLGPITIALYQLFSQAHSTQAAAISFSNETIVEGSVSSISAFTKRMQENGIDNMEFIDSVLFACIVVFGMEFLSFAVKNSGRIINWKEVPVRGKHLDDLSLLDKAFIVFNKTTIFPFLYTFVKFMYGEPNAIWSIEKISIRNFFLPIPLFFFIYDFFYTLLHWALHIQSIYGYIHKHHHRQKAPSRGNVDATNVHPVEFFLGEWNHLFAAYIYTHLLGFQMHILTIPIILALGSVLAGFNHTRFDTKITLFGKVTIYDSKWHDVHHRIPQSNYGQYINFWDVVFGTFRSYNPHDRINPDNQLDPKSGKSLKYGTNKVD